MRRNAFFTLAVLMAGLVPVGGAQADGSESLGPSIHERVIGGGVVSAGVGLAGRVLNPPRGGQPGTISIAGIPGDGQVRRAVLYWAVRGYADAAATFNGQPVTGTPIGTSVDAWSCGLDQSAGHHVYRADVTARVGGNGTYAISGVGDGAGNDGEGASLVVVFEQPNAATMTDVFINDGAITGGNLGDGRPGGGFEDLATTFTGLSLPSAPLSAALHVGFGDGSGTPSEYNPGAGPLKIAGVSLASPGFLTSSAGGLWDDATFAIPAGTLPAGASTALVEINSGDDCILWTYSALELHVPDGFPPIVRGVPDRLPTPDGWYNAPVTIHWDVSDPNGATAVPDTIASTEGADVLYTSGQSCDGLGNCGSGSIRLSIDKTKPETEVRGGLLFFEDVPVSAVRLFDSWISGSASDGLSGVSTVLVEVWSLEDDTRSVAQLQYLNCDQNRSRCEFGAQIPEQTGAYRVTVSAVDRAGNRDGSPYETTVLMPPNPFGDGPPPICIGPLEEIVCD